MFLDENIENSLSFFGNKLNCDSVDPFLWLLHDSKYKNQVINAYCQDGSPIWDLDEIPSSSTVTTISTTTMTTTKMTTKTSTEFSSSTTEGFTNDTPSTPLSSGSSTPSTTQSIGSSTPSTTQSSGSTGDPGDSSAIDTRSSSFILIGILCFSVKYFFNKIS